MHILIKLWSEFWCEFEANSELDPEAFLVQTWSIFRGILKYVQVTNLKQFWSDFWSKSDEENLKHFWSIFLKQIRWSKSEVFQMGKFWSISDQHFWSQSDRENLKHFQIEIWSVSEQNLRQLENISGADLEQFQRYKSATFRADWVILQRKFDASLEQKFMLLQNRLLKPIQSTFCSSLEEISDAIQRQISNPFSDVNLKHSERFLMQISEVVLMPISELISDAFSDAHFWCIFLMHFKTGLDAFQDRFLMHL